MRHDDLQDVREQVLLRLNREARRSDVLDRAAVDVRAGTCNQRVEPVEQGRQPWRSGPDVLEEEREAVGPEDAADLSQPPYRVGHRTEHARCDDRVETTGREA